MMRVDLGGGRTTSRLGFGCALLAGGLARGASLRLLESAFDAGVTHFDVAPSYGMGLAEDILSDFLVTRRDAVTVATKVGLSRPAAPGALALARSLARPLLAFTPGLRRRLAGGVYRMSVATARFELSEVTASLAESLKRLRTDHIELLLLHELTPDDVTDELARFAQDAVAAGKVGAFGFGSARPVTEQLVATHPSLGAVVQTNWSVGDASLAFAAPRLIITHGALRRLDAMTAWLHAEPGRLRAVSDAAGADLEGRAQLAELMLGAALAANPAGLALVATHRPARIAAHAALAGDAERIAQGAKFAATLAAAGFSEQAWL